MTDIAKGARRVELLRPFEKEGGGTVTALIFQPVKALHLFRWETGQIHGQYGHVYALMSELCGLPADDLMQMTFPDVDMVMAEFMGHIPEGIRVSIRDNQLPPPALTLPERDYDDDGPVEPLAHIPEGYNDLGPLMEQAQARQAGDLPDINSRDPTALGDEDDGAAMDLGDE